MEIHCPGCGKLLIDEGRSPIICPHCHLSFTRTAAPNPALRTRAPATALLIYAIAAFFLNCVTGYVVSSIPRPRDPEIAALPRDDPRARGAAAAYFMESVVIGGTTCCTMFLIYPLILIGALRMQNQRNYWLAVATCVFAMLPCSLGCIIGAPLGLWGLMVLFNPGVREHFHS